MRKRSRDIEGALYSNYAESWEKEIIIHPKRYLPSSFIQISIIVQMTDVIFLLKMFDSYDNIFYL